MKNKNDHVLKEICVFGAFRVTDAGRIETNRKWNGRRDVIVDWYTCDRADGKGYRYVSYHMVRLKAHRVAYTLYHPEIDITGMEINHLDGDPLNNRRENLEACDARRQSKHAFDIGLNKAVGERHHRSKLDPEKVMRIRSLRGQGLPYKRIAEQYAVTPRTVYLVCTRATWAHVA